MAMKNSRKGLGGENLKVAVLSLSVLLLLLGSACSLLEDLVDSPTEVVCDQNIIEGTVELASALPDAAASDYPNCNFTCVLKVKQILLGEVVPTEIVLVLEGFRDRVDLGNKIAKGDRVRVSITPLEAMPEDFQQIQLADDNDNFALPYFAVNKFEKVKWFSGGNNPLPREPEASRWWKTPLNPPLSEYSRKVRAQQIESALKVNGARIAELEKKLPQYEQAISEFTQTHKGFACCWKNDAFFGLSPGTFFIGSYNVSQEREYGIYTAISQLTALSRFLAFHNIDLVVCILPSPNEIAVGEVIPGAAGYQSLPKLKFVRELLLADVDAVDLYDHIYAHRYDYPLIFQYHRNNDHPHTGMCALAGQFLADYLAKRKYLTVQEMEGKIVPCTHTFYTNLWTVENQRYPVKSPAPASKVEWTRSADAAADKEVLIAGNSFSTYPVSGGTFGDFWTYYSHVPYTWIGGENGASSIPQKIMNNGIKVLPNKKVVILFAGAGHLQAPDFQDIELLANSAKIYSLPCEQELAPAPPPDADAAKGEKADTSSCEMTIAIPKGVSPKQILAIKLHLSAAFRSPWAFAEIPEYARQNFRPEPKGGTVTLKLTKKLRRRKVPVRFYFPAGQKFTGTLTQIDFYLGDEK